MSRKRAVRTDSFRESARRVVVLGIGAFAQAALRHLRNDGARVEAYLTRPYGHWGPRQEGPCITAASMPDPCGWLQETPPDVIVPMSIEWAVQSWTQRFLDLRPALLCPTGEALRIERDRDFARGLCERFRVPFPASRRVATRAEAERFLRRHPRPYVLKNPLCAPGSPIQTIVCETAAETRAWLPRLDDAEGIFLQEYLGRREAGHIALVSGGEIHSLVTNQEYKRAFDGNQGIVAGAPLGGLVERDPGDRYGLARELLHPLKPWFRAAGYRGPIQVTAIAHQGRWHVLEYNVRLGVTSGPLILGMLDQPTETLTACARDEPIHPTWKPRRTFGCSLTLAGYGYPYVQLEGPRVPVRISGAFTCDVNWQEVDAGPDGSLQATGHRICDVSALASSLTAAVRTAYANIRRIHSLGSYYRTDVGRSLWPPGSP